MRTYALSEIEQIVLTGSGPTRDGGKADAARITPTECRLLQRVLFSPASDTAAGISRGEAEMLFRLKDATLGADNAPEWADVFVKGVANHLMGHHRFVPPSTERALELDRFLSDAMPRVGSFLGRMARAQIGGGLADAAREAFGFGRKGRDQGGRDHAGEAAADAQLTETENAWLQAQVDADSHFDELDRALLRFLAEAENAA